MLIYSCNLLNANPTKWSNTLNLSANCLSVFDHFVKMALQGLNLLKLSPRILESWIKIKINLNFYFHTSLWCLKRFYEDLKGLQKTFRGTKKKCQNKNLIFSLRPGSGQKVLIIEAKFGNIPPLHKTIKVYYPQPSKMLRTKKTTFK